METNYAIEVKKLTHYYGKKNVFTNLNFDVMHGSIFGLLGKNGTGKTTTINILNGFLKPTSGHCKIYGEDSYKLSPKVKADVGFLIEGHIQYGFMDVKQIEKFYSGFYPKWDKEPYYELIAKLKITEKQKISKMSCGQRSQVALALLLAQNPKLLILDDYSIGLDAGYRRLFLDYLKEYTKSKGTTIFVTSHIIQDLDGFLEQCVIMDYDSLLLKTNVEEFKKNFKQYSFVAEDTSALQKDEIIKNIETLGKNNTLFTFANYNEIKNYLEQKSVAYKNLTEVEMTLEDAFIGLTGKY